MTVTKKQAQAYLPAYEGGVRPQAQTAADLARTVVEQADHIERLYTELHADGGWIERATTAEAELIAQTGEPIELVPTPAFVEKVITEAEGPIQPSDYYAIRRLIAELEQINADGYYFGDWVLRRDATGPVPA